MLRQLRRIGVLGGAAAALVLAAAGPAFAVAHGEPAAPGQYRFAVKLTMTDIPRPDGSHYDSACSAALVAAQWIITAGHCFHDVYRNPVSGPVPYPTTATIGVVDLTDPGAQVVNVVWVQQSPSTDIAVAALDRPVAGVPAIELSTAKPKAGGDPSPGRLGCGQLGRPGPGYPPDDRSGAGQQRHQQHGRGTQVRAVPGHERLRLRLGRAVLPRAPVPRSRCWCPSRASARTARTTRRRRPRGWTTSRTGSIG